MSFKPLTSPPEDQLLASIEALVRSGIPALTAGAAWTDEACPAGHWLCPAGARVYRFDVPDKARTPCVIMSFWKDCAPRSIHDDRYWLLYPMVDLLWHRDLTEVETQQIRMMLQNVFTADIGAPAPAPQQRAIDRLSLDPGAGTPGIRVLAIRDVICPAIKEEKGHPSFELSFQVLCSGIQPLPSP